MTKDIVAQAELDALRIELAVVKEEIVALNRDKDQIRIKLNRLNELINDMEFNSGDFVSIVSSDNTEE